MHIYILNAKIANPLENAFFLDSITTDLIDKLDKFKGRRSQSHSNSV